MIFNRKLTIRKFEKETQELLKIGEVYELDGTWYCEWSLGRLHPENGRFSEQDPLAACLRTLRFVSRFIRDSEKDGYQIFWETPGDHGGFPRIGDNSPLPRYYPPSQKNVK